jgi:phosphatidylserine decarboxylase
LRETPIAREGMPLIILSLFLSALFFALNLRLPGVFFLILLIFFLFFFRNPKRRAAGSAEDLISPADGRILDLAEFQEVEFIGGPARRVSIFMSPLDVHVNRAPCEGRVEKVEHRRGEFALAFKKDIDKENERNYILLTHEGDRVLLVQIAGFLARRITSYVRPGETVQRGDRVGIIAFGSRVDMYVPMDYDIIIGAGERVKAGVTPLARKRG